MFRKCHTKISTNIVSFGSQLSHAVWDSSVQMDLSLCNVVYFTYPWLPSVSRHQGPGGQGEEAGLGEARVSQSSVRTHKAYCPARSCM